jgi:hypothetical protein
MLEKWGDFLFAFCQNKGAGTALRLFIDPEKQSPKG